MQAIRNIQQSLRFPRSIAMVPYLLLGLIFFSAGPAQARAITLTKSNLASATSTLPVIALVYFPCGTGENVLNYAFQDVKGVNVAALNVQKPAPFNHPDFDLDTVFLIHKGKILAHKKIDKFREIVGTSYLRSWAYHALKEHGFSVQMKRPTDLLVDPIREPATAVDLKKGLVGFFDFEGGRSSNQAAGGVGSFRLKMESGNFRIKDNALYGDGEYFNGGNKGAREAAYNVPAATGSKFMQTGFTIHMNYNSLPDSDNTVDPEGSFVLNMLGDHVQLRVSRGRLLMSLISDKRKGKVYQTAEDQLYLTDAKIKFGEWYGIVVRFDFNKKRASVLVNGKRTRDIALNDLWLKLLGDRVYQGAGFYYGRAGSLLGGSVDNLVIYDRPLSAQEMRAVYTKFKRDDSAEENDIEPPPIDRTALNLQLLSAAYAGDIKKARTALDRGADVNAKSRGWTSLMFAAYFNRLTLAKLLAGRGADPHVQKDGWNAQQMATQKGHKGVAQFLSSQLRSERFCDCQLGLPAYKTRDVGGPTRP